MSLGTLSDLEECLAHAEAVLRDFEDDHAPKTVADHAATLKSFCNWAEARGYIDRNPLARMGTYDTTPQTIRRAMSIDEIKRVLAVARPDRRLLYQVAFLTGLRADELRSLTADHLDTERGGLRIDAAWTKNRRPGFCNIHAGLMRELVSYSQSGDAQARYKQADAFVSHGKERRELPENPLLYVPTGMAVAFYRDLAAAGIPKHAPGGKIDFHAARTAYGNLVIGTGADIKTAMSAMRHASADMTLNVYGRTNGRAMQELADTLGTLVQQPQNSPLFSDKG